MTTQTKLGRPAIPDLERWQVTLDKQTSAYLYKLGGDNLSAGIRKAAAVAKRVEGKG